MAKNYFLVDDKTDNIVNTVVLENLNDWPAPKGYTLYEIPADMTAFNVGWKYNKGNPIDPNPPVEPAE